MQRMKECRERAGLSRKELAEKTGLAPRTIDYIEDGVKSPRVENAMKIARALGVTIADLMDDAVA
jgi:transcriptional regulator with XRE-family HTH domain